MMQWCTWLVTFIRLLFSLHLRVKISPFAVTSTKFHLQRIPTWLTSRVHCPTPGIHTIRLRVYGCSSLLACRSTAVSLTNPTAVWLSCMIPRSVVPLSTNWLFAVHGPSGCSTERPPGSNVRMCIGQVLAMSTVNGTLPAHCNLLHYHSILGAAFYMLPHIGLGAAIIADPVHMVSPPMGIIIILPNKPLSTFKLWNRGCYKEA